MLGVMCTVGVMGVNGTSLFPECQWMESGSDPKGPFLVLLMVVRCRTHGLLPYSVPLKPLTGTGTRLPSLPHHVRTACAGTIYIDRQSQIEASCYMLSLRVSAR